MKLIDAINKQRRIIRGLIVDTVHDLNNIEGDPIIGDIIYCTKDRRTYVYTGKEYLQFTPEPEREFEYSWS